MRDPLSLPSRAMNEAVREHENNQLAQRDPQLPLKGVTRRGLFNHASFEADKNGFARD